MASLLAVRMCLRPQIVRTSILRQFTNDSRETIGRTGAKRRTLRERAMAPATGSALSLGQGVMAGGALLGIGSLCYYGLGMSGQMGTVERSALWPQYIKDRIKTTYMYFGGSVIVTAASAVAVFRSPGLLNLVSRGGFMGLALSLAAMWGTGILCQSIEYKEGFGAKQMAWILHTGVIGGVLAPMCLLGGPILVRAAWYTGGIVTALSTIAVCAPSEKFLMMGGPLAMGLGVVFASSVGSMFLSPATALGSGLYAISLYGGLLLFSGFLLYDTQRIIKQAEGYTDHPHIYGVHPYDPVNASISIYLDTLNIFIRIAMILTGGGGQRRK